MSAALEHQDLVERNLDEALRMTSNIAAGYQSASAKTTRLYNHAMFSKVFVGTTGISAVELSEGFALLLHPAVIRAAKSRGDGSSDTDAGLGSFDQLFKDLVNMPEIETAGPEGVSSLSYEHLVGVSRHLTNPQVRLDSGSSRGLRHG